MRPLDHPKRIHIPEEKEGRKLVKRLEEEVKFSPWIMQLQAQEYERPPPLRIS
jgi:hypothetical protein